MCFLVIVLIIIAVVGGYVWYKRHSKDVDVPVNNDPTKPLPDPRDPNL